MAFMTEADWLDLALDGSDQDCVGRTGMSRARVIAKAIALTEEAGVALAHPVLVQRVRARVDEARARRRDLHSRLMKP